MSINTPDLGLEIPPLQEGDRLTADEFHRRYEAMPRIINANLIDGIAYVTPHFRNGHGRACGELHGMLWSYACRLDGIRGLINITWRLDDHNEPQPDIVFRHDSPLGKSWFDSVGFLKGTPELVAEIADDDTVALDIGPKRELYQRTGVQEYIVWRIREHRVDCWGLVDGTYQPLPSDGNGVIRSRVFPGLWLDVPSMIRGDSAKSATVIDAGLASPEHKDFARRLNPRG